VYRIRKAAAEEALEKLRLSPDNRAFAGYWLSLWQGDELPFRQAFNPWHIRELVPNLIEFEAVPQTRVTIRKAGREIVQIAREELDGVDWVMGAPVRERGVRMRSFTKLTDGAISIVRRRLTMASGPPLYNEELSLPFAPHGGIHPVVAHADWKVDPRLRRSSILEIEIMARNYSVLSICRKSSTAI
jgi:hypothetical protein